MFETIQDLINQIRLCEDSTLEFKDLRYKDSFLRMIYFDE